jgi:hypothetical protein
VPTVLRDNASDPRVSSDVAKLAAAYSEDAIAAAEVAAEHARQVDLEQLVAVYGVEEQRSALLPLVIRHLRRYRTPYLVAAVVLGVLLFRGPVPPPLEEAAEETTDVGAPAAVSAAPLAATGPSDAFALAPSSPLDVTGLESPVPEPEAGDFSSPAPAAASPSPPPSILQIAVSGYASALGGTPVEQPPPGDGLPVESIGGSTTKYSFFRLTGGGTILRLKMLGDNGASLNDAAAGVEVCHLSSGGWKAGRGVATSDAPAYDSDCVAGTRSDTVWTFRFVLDDPVGGNGWAVVPVTTGNATFRITFAPQTAG